MPEQTQATAAPAQPATDQPLNTSSLAVLLAQRTAARLAPTPTEPEASKPEGEEVVEEVQTQEADTQEAEVQDPESTEEVVDEKPADEVEDGEQDPEDAGVEKPAWYQKRLSKMASQKRELSEKAEALEAERAALAAEKADLERQLSEATPAVQSSADPLAWIKSERDLLKFDSQLKSSIGDLAYFVDSDGADGVEAVKKLGQAIDLIGEDGEPSIAKARRVLRQLEDTRRENLPAKASFLREEAQLSAQARIKYPFWNDRDSEEYRTANQALAALPELKRYPGWMEMASVYAIGLKTIQAQAKSAGKAATAKPKPGVVPAPKVRVTPSGTPRVAPKPDQYKAALEKHQLNPSARSLADLLAARSSK